MRERAWHNANGICAVCQSQIELHYGVIHHTVYPAGVYEREVEMLMEEGICVWLCRACHEQMHIAQALEETNGSVKNAGECFYCGRTAFGGWERARTLGIDHCICRSCYQARVHRRQAEESGQISLFGTDG